MSQSHSDKITDPSIRRLFNEKNLVFVSTLMSNGYPHITPTWVDIDDGNILINTAIGRVIEQIKGDTAEKHIDRLAKKYLGKDEYPNRTAGELY